MGRWQEYQTAGNEGNSQEAENRLDEEEDKGMLAFRVRGNEVEERKIERWIKEKGIPESPDARRKSP